MLRPMVLSYGLHDPCPTIEREFIEGNRGVYA